MSLRDELAGVLARDSRYTIQGYAFVFEALDFAKAQKRRQRARTRTRRLRAADGSLHVNGRELCAAARDLALRHYGLLAWAVMSQWGIRTTSDLGNIVYNLIASGDLEKTSSDSRTDFEGVFDLETALKRDFVVPLDDVA
jgi:uncharacterized repeat protein (TIGR04138 family)